MKKSFFGFLVFAACALAPSLAKAEGAAPEMFGVREVVIEYTHFGDPKSSDTCGVTREEVASSLAKALTNVGVPAIAVIDAKPPVAGIARIHLIPTLDTHADESLNCLSWISLSAENRVNAVIPPVPTLRAVTVLYWRQHTVVNTSQSMHQKTVDDVLQKMAGQFAQQYRLDQPPELPK